ncbi:unnamed protein product [Bursaphelenchus okinawaensis]|uniref:Uncharacterized protein n=1 Tax=Bursaphelenchus okinawaensis TaxID=465554 RepID=A0A811KRF2_9BILA|nr:unnamed protein product [Bursaphelenchus okinawaensis]CAG9110109.1 unnamed protein product [Bursaphelenchus okinawaensis]
MNRSETAREAAISVLKDSGSKVILMLKVPGLKRQKSLIKALIRLFKKPNDPFTLSTNAQFVNYALTNGSLDFSVDVYENQKALKDRSEVKQNYFCKINQFPSRINPESAEFELVEGASGDCYFLLTAIKLDNLNTNWKEYQATNGTLDIAEV